MSHFIIAAQASPQGPSQVIFFGQMILIFLIFYLIWFRPLRKKQKALEDLIGHLKKGDKVVTNGGLYGEVAKVENEVVFLKLNDTVKVRVAKRAIAGLEEGPEKTGEK